jgi:hypothetical protein
MTTYDQLPVYKASYDLLLKTYALVKHFPKEYKYDLGAGIKQDIFTLTKLIYRANCTLDRLGFIALARETLETLKLSFRLSKDLRLLSLEKYVVVSTLLEEISRQLVGREKSARRSAST